MVEISFGVILMLSVFFLIEYEINLLLLMFSSLLGNWPYSTVFISHLIL